MEDIKVCTRYNANKKCLEKDIIYVATASMNVGNVWNVHNIMVQIIKYNNELGYECSQL